MDFSRRLDELEQRVAATKATVQAAAAESREQLRQRIDQAQQDAKDAQQRAQQRADALDFAEWAVDNAQLAMLDAIDARVYADDLAKAASS
jgi:DNA anti-recombination protein RmuC